MTLSDLYCVANRLTRLFMFYCSIVQSCHGGHSYRTIITAASSYNVHNSRHIAYRTEYHT